MTTADAFDAMAAILPDLATITGDETVIELHSLFAEKGKNVIRSADLTKRLMPVFLTKYRDEFLRIAAAFRGVTVEELKKQPFNEAMQAFKEGYGDFMLFFGLCLRLVVTA